MRPFTSRSPIILVMLMVLFLSSCSSLSRKIEHQNRVKLGKLTYVQIQASDLPWTVQGTSVEGREIYQLELGKGDSTILIFGGIHGSEISGVQLALGFTQYLYEEKQDELNCRVLLIPVLNPDGLVVAQRRNANGVDVNRNFPTDNWTTKHRSAGNFPGDSPASEPETLLLMNLLEELKPDRIVSIHAPLRVVNYDGPAQALAQAMAEQNKYPVSSDIGYPTPGSFGTYAGVERQIPIVTLELPRGEFTEEVWLANRNALLAAVTLD